MGEVSETVEIKLPRGPAAFCSERISGKPPKGSYHVQKTYHVTIEPHAQQKLVKRPHASCERRLARKERRSLWTGFAEEALPAIANNPETVLEVAQKERRRGSHRNDEAQRDHDTAENLGHLPQIIEESRNKQEGYYARVSFRQQRAPAFAKAKLFPALANQRLVPEWRESGSHYEDDNAHLSGRQRTQRRLAAPTLTGAIRQQSRRVPPSVEFKWLPHLDAGEIKKQYSRSPALCIESYCPPGEMRFREESDEGKRRWLVDSTFACPSLSGAKMALARTNGEHDGVDVEKEIHEMRGRGAQNNVSLQCRYEMKLEAFKDEQDRRGSMSNFAKRELDMKKRDALEPIREQDPHQHDGGLGELKSIGFSRFRSSRLPIGAGDE